MCAQLNTLRNSSLYAPDQEKKQYAAQLSQIISYVEKINKLDMLQCRTDRSYRRAQERFPRRHVLPSIDPRRRAHRSQFTAAISLYRNNRRRVVKMKEHSPARRSFRPTDIYLIRIKTDQALPGQFVSVRGETLDPFCAVRSRSSISPDGVLT